MYGKGTLINIYNSKRSTKILRNVKCSSVLFFSSRMYLKEILYTACFFKHSQIADI